MINCFDVMESRTLLNSSNCGPEERAPSFRLLLEEQASHLTPFSIPSINFCESAESNASLPWEGQSEAQLRQAQVGLSVLLQVAG
jgi:hypothetical protein